jgi:lysozyme family protein
MNFDDAFARLTGNEGGYVNDPNDPGGETKFGISKRAYPEEDIAGLTLERAKYLTQRDFWGPAGCDALPDVMKFQMLDMAFNTSAPGRPATAIKMLQEAAGADVDGVLGPHTLAAVNAADPQHVLRRLQGVLLRYYTELENWPRYGKGWAGRLAGNMIEV